MKITSITTFAVVLFFSAFISNAQSLSLKVGGTAEAHVVEAHFKDVIDLRNKVFEGVVQGVSAEDCQANRDFSMLRQVGPETASLSYDFSTGVYTVKWVVPKGSTEPCRMLVVGRSASGADYAMWQSEYGNSSLAEDMSRLNATQTGTYSWGLDRIDQR